VRVAEVLDHAWFCEAAGTEITALAAAVADAPDLSAAVPGCPDWTVADLARHTGIIHRWATSIVVSRATARAPLPEVSSPWSSADGWAQWLTAGAGPLLAALRAAGPVTPVWTWGPGRTSGWWARRVLHETVVHRVDAELALGAASPATDPATESAPDSVPDVAPDPKVDPVVATDGIDEFLFNLPSARRPNLPSARRPYRHLASLPTGATLHLHATDVDGEWMIRCTESGITWERGHGKATVAVRGDVTSLLLLIYGRRTGDDPRLAVFGDPALLEAWREKTAL
jgi:uncharacterized protein (TIGR03083 family)